MRMLAWVVFGLGLAEAGCGAKKDEPEGDKNKRAAEAAVKAIDALKAGDWDAAIKLSSEAIKLDPTVADRWWVRGNAYHGKKEYDAAIADFTEALKRDPKHAPSLRERGRSHARKGEHTKAIDDYTEYLKLRPDDPEVYELRAVSYDAIKDIPHRTADLRQAEKLRGKQP
ncbi:MAG TPA: tetratricopeptide repeat protein [Gemmataceae bacterium]|nr:tetratricopeptide repeat protein [Gemmataceae bacterium]